jgi:hypothetical protein
MIDGEKLEEKSKLASYLKTSKRGNGSHGGRKDGKQAENPF